MSDEQQEIPFEYYEGVLAGVVGTLEAMQYSGDELRKAVWSVLSHVMNWPKDMVDSTLEELDWLFNEEE